jgi:uncharacterized protein (TIGR03086 family)
MSGMERRADTTADETARLVALGRDREAALLHARPDPETNSPQGATVEVTEQLDVVLPALVGLARTVTPDQLDRPTPCADFTVEGVFSHMIGGAGLFAAQFRGEGPPEPPADGADLTGDDPVATFVGAMEALADAATQPGALDRTVVSPFGEVSGTFAARYLVFDGTVHAWDIATATGQTFIPPDALVVDVLDFAREVIGPEMRVPGAFDPEIVPPADATLLEQLVAFTGRTV